MLVLRRTQSGLQVLVLRRTQAGLQVLVLRHTQAGLPALTGEAHRGVCGSGALWPNRCVKEVRDRRG